jgi:membrane-associated protease RseP (regulator of RpoE activity)
MQVVVVKPTRQRWALHICLFVATLFSTLVVGAQLEVNFLTHRPAFSPDSIFPLEPVLAHPARLLLGVPFSVTLMLILLAHEMGHFLFCLRYRVRATLPYFIPAPNLIGTLGAVIRIKSPFPSRAALFDIGIAGPIAGFAIAAPALAIGMWLSRVEPLVVANSEPTLGYPAIFQLLWALLPLSDAQGGSSALQDIYFHPVAVAAWIGMFATALNLLPAGQLDGGHILFALSPRSHRVVSRITTLALLGLGVYYWLGWLLAAAFLMFFGMRHPQVAPYPELDAKRKLLALFALLMFIVTFTAAPLPGSLMEIVKEFRHGP